jgi:ATP-dependent RNA helicase DeaD
VLPSFFGRPKVMSTMPFSSLPNLISQALAEQGYAEPTPVQAAVLGAEAHDRDLVSAQTGSGKTVAFGVAMAARLLSEDNGFNRAPGALVIAPTRELALQVSRELTWLFGKAGIRITTCVGGMDAARERRTLAQGTHVVVGTPGRLRDHLERGALDLSALHHVVLDEADEMLDMGFREDLEEILEATPEGRRTLLFSATMPKPIVALARRYQRDALRISTVSDNVGHGDITYQAVAVSPADIENAVINLLRFHEAETAILFCATRDSIRHLHSSLIERGFAAVALSGEHSQNERNNALQALRDGRARICVATDVAARGIDIPSLSLVIHVEVPRDAEVLQHRSGRTGRAGRKGVAVMIALPASSPGRRHAPHRPRHRRMGAGPEPGSIRERDRERLLADLLQPIRSSDADRDLAERILAAMSPTDVALALVQARKRGIPDPEELIEQSQADAGARRPSRRVRRRGLVPHGHRSPPECRSALAAAAALPSRAHHPQRDRRDPDRRERNLFPGSQRDRSQVPRRAQAHRQSRQRRRSGITIEPSPEAPQDTGRDRPRGARHNAGPGRGPRGKAPDVKGAVGGAPAASPTGSSARARPATATISHTKKPGLTTPAFSLQHQDAPERSVHVLEPDAQVIPPGHQRQHRRRPQGHQSDRMPTLNTSPMASTPTRQGAPEDQRTQCNHLRRRLPLGESGHRDRNLQSAQEFAQARNRDFADENDQSRNDMERSDIRTIITPRAASTRMTAATMILSAMGSRKTPSFETAPAPEQDSRRNSR